MTISLPLLIFLLINILLVGVALTIAVQHGLAHYKPHPVEPKKHDTKDGHLSAELREKMLHASQANFQTVLDRSARQLQHDLDITTGQLNKVLQRIGTEIVSNEMERYRIQLESIRDKAGTAIGAAEDEIAQHQAQLKAELEEQRATLKAKLLADIEAEKQQLVEEIITEKQHLTQQIDTKLADAVASFLIENLGHNVDLGAQTAYLTALLEEHKEEFKKELHDGA